MFQISLVKKLTFYNYSNCKSVDIICDIFFVAQRKEGILALHTTNLPSFLDVYFLIKTIIFYQTVCVENNPIFPKINEN